MGIWVCRLAPTLTVSRGAYAPPKIPGTAGSNLRVVGDGSRLFKFKDGPEMIKDGDNSRR